MSSLKTLLLSACLIAAPASVMAEESNAATGDGETYFAQVQLVRLIPIKKGGAKHSVLADLKRIAKASCDRADASFISKSSAIYDMQVYGPNVQYSASIQCK